VFTQAQHSDFSLTWNDEIPFRTTQRRVDDHYDDYPEQRSFFRHSACRSRSLQHRYHRTTVETIESFDDSSRHSFDPSPPQPVRSPSTPPRPTPSQSYQLWDIRYHATTSSTSLYTPRRHHFQRRLPHQLRSPHFRHRQHHQNRNYSSRLAYPNEDSYYPANHRT